MTKVTKTGPYQNANVVLFWPISTEAKHILVQEELMPRNKHNDFIFQYVNKVVDCYFSTSNKTEQLTSDCIQAVDLILNERILLDKSGLALKTKKLSRAITVANNFTDKENEMQK